MSLEKIEQLTDMNNLNLSIFLPRSIDEEVNRFIIIIIIIFMLVTCGGSFLQRWDTRVCDRPRVCASTAFTAAAKCGPLACFLHRFSREVLFLSFPGAGRLVQPVS